MEEFIKKLNFSYGKYREYEIFADVIKLTAFFIQINILFNLEYEKKYKETLEKYDDDEKNIIQCLIIELCLLFEKQEEPIDILGKIFHIINANNKELGQFFTPIHLQELCSELICINEKEIKEKGYIKIIEPSSGSGGMIISYAKMMKKKGYDYHKKMFVKAKDLDILCTYMTYVQLSLYDIPAIVENGDTLSGELNFVFKTPAYVLKKYE